MRDTRGLDDLVRRLAELMPESVRHVQADIEKNLRAGLSGAMQRMELVTREEYEIQAQLLARSRERLSELEARVEALESAAGTRPPGTGPAPGSE